MFEGLEQIAAPKGVVGKDGLRRVGWAELAAAISLSRNLRGGEQGLLAQAGPSFDNTEPKDERGINPRSLEATLARAINPLDSTSYKPGDVPAALLCC